MVLLEIHPFNRPSDDDLRIIQPYDAVGLFEDEKTVAFHWHVMDILARGAICAIPTICTEKRNDNPFWVPCSERVRDGHREYNHAEAHRLYNGRETPLRLPQWMCAVGGEMNMITVRCVTISDIPAIVEIEAGEEGPWGDPVPCKAWTARRLERGFFIQIAFLDGKPAGHAEWILSDESAVRTLYLGCLQVKKDLQRSGVGRAMLSSGEAEARRLCCANLSTIPDLDTGSEVFYQKCGFERTRTFLCLDADALDTKVPFEEIPSIPDDAVRGKRFVAGFLQSASRHMYEVVCQNPDASERIVRYARIPGGFLALMWFPGQDRAQALAWGDFSARDALLGSLAFAHGIGVPHISFVFDACEADAVRALEIGAFVDFDSFEMIKRLG